MLTDLILPAEIVLMIRAIIDDLINVSHIQPSPGQLLWELGIGRGMQEPIASEQAFNRLSDKAG
jgi:hypothetical protein